MKSQHALDWQAPTSPANSVAPLDFGASPMRGPPTGLSSPGANRGACGVGVLVDLSGNKTHRLVEDGLRILCNLDHRGARGAEEKTGDGAGMLLQKPHKFFQSQIPELGEFDSYGVAQIFCPKDHWKQIALKKLVTTICRENGFRIIAWRDVPTDNFDLGKTAQQSEPAVKQFFVEPIDSQIPEQLDAKLYVLRRLIEKAAKAAEIAGDELFYICSLDRRTIVYKGLLTCKQLRLYFPDLSDERMATALLLVHSRFGTNTLGAWELAHPYRVAVHNGEINTLRGNLNRMKTREAVLASARFGADIEKIKPVTSEGLSDTALFDNVLELMLESGRSLPHALRMLIPEAWNKDKFMDPKRRAFYDYFSTIVEPWDGPALIAATDGYSVAAVLDRNGLRPCRYCVTKGNILIMASETGVLDTPASEIVFKARLRPGQMFLADTRQKRLVPEEEIFAGLTTNGYTDWLGQNRVRLRDIVTRSKDEEKIADVTPYQRAFGYTLESLRCLVLPMAEEGKDPIGSMGNDTPLSVLSARYKPLFQYFLQLFAQVSNPPLDYLREDLVTSLESHIGSQNNMLEETPEHCRQLFLDSPILTHGEMAAIKKLGAKGIRSCPLDISFQKGVTLEMAIGAIRQLATEAINRGCEILVLSDRNIGPERVAVPSLLAIGALHHHLIRAGLRTRVALVLESGQPCAVHHFCTLIGYGADAIYPWLAYESIAQLAREGWLEGNACEPTARFKTAVEGGILKVMSKMGISTLESYKGAQVFQAVGLDRDFVQEYFTGTTAHLGGVGLDQIERELIEQHELAFGEKIAGNLPLETGGELYWRRDGELHQWNPITVGKLQHAVRTGNYDAYREFADFLNDQDRRLQTIRGLLDFDTDAHEAVPIDEVEPVAEIFKRFSTGSMSLGALSTEAHETLAIAMKRIGGKAGTGEGGEQVERFGTERECTMKQVASGRFGVTINYLAQAKQIEIKMAQGSKPGEGGELPGTKVNGDIASVRFTTPGVGLISPPPHHDIYSIEDLAQLIHDLKCANPDAEIHVKLVSVAGVGTIAAGVAKARADAVLIAGDSGGTGASIKTSIKSAGAPWELGLAETQQILLANNLRSRIRVRADGGLKTGRDVVIAALLGAEEFGFGTAPLVALGCIMLRKCHCNTCSVGIATQDPRLRAKFSGQPEHVINYMNFVAREIRELMAALGFRTVDEMVGRVDRLRPRNAEHPKGAHIDLSQLLFKQPSSDAPRKMRDQNHKLDKKIDHRLIELAQPAIERGEPVTIEMPINNSDRTAATMLSSAVAKKYGAQALPHDTITIRFTGSAGQSFGAFLARGITLHLEGDANDYVGKGLSGGKITVSTPRDASFVASQNIIVGNVTLYGATSGEAYFNGMGGERFAVRNSGAMAVVEGVGDHGCEYMTGGVVIILGATGKNFGAGMSGGEAFIFNEDGTFASKLNPSMVRLDPFTEERDHELVKRMLENHIVHTNSSKARQILERWDESASKFAKVIPQAYAEVLARQLAEGKDVRLAPPPRAEERKAA
jgi:glutamate synthase domain-containing protein 2/glutamate synthase domain-containing protein 1/glutamate synthase domain-containing protein 3